MLFTVARFFVRVASLGFFLLLFPAWLFCDSVCVVDSLLFSVFTYSMSSFIALKNFKRGFVPPHNPGGSADAPCPSGAMVCRPSYARPSMRDGSSV